MHATSQPELQYLAAMQSSCCVDEFFFQIGANSGWVISYRKYIQALALHYKWSATVSRHNFSLYLNYIPN